ncbi:MAG: hypothetical protein JOZ77_08300 [Candidatus Eremiobacteraeota bacterium]|nr:hypothetical protein [Candidatus Eremiobacteraeota bacterium]
MKFSDVSRYATGVGSAAVVLAGCTLRQSGSTQEQPGLPATALQSAKHLSSNGTAFTVSGRYILLNGKKFYVKGVSYSPTPIGNGVSDPPGLDDVLRNGNSGIWERDLPALRAMGVNAVHVYNVVPPPYDKPPPQGPGPITNWLNAAWNNGNDPIFVFLTVYFDGKALTNENATRDLANQYRALAEKYAAYPAVMGVIISNEIVKPPWWTDATWWKNFNRIADAARAGFKAGGHPDKLVATSDVDSIVQEGGVDHLAAVYYGEKYGAKVDVWGDNPYRGRTFTGLFSEIQRDTKKPVVLTEYGAPASYHPDLMNTYFHPNTLHGVGYCVPDREAGPLNRHAAELPDSGNPGMNGLVDLVTNNNTLMYNSFSSDGTVSGGFYFEWTDEWWKADPNNPSYRNTHVGDAVFTGHFPGCAYDHAWFGLNGLKISSRKYIDTLEPRPTIDALKAQWAKEQ